MVALVVRALVASPAPGWRGARVPSPPRSVRVVPGNARATVSWHDAVSNGGQPDHRVRGRSCTTNDVALAINVFKSTATTQMIVGSEERPAPTRSRSPAKNTVGWSKLSARSAPATVGVPVAAGEADGGRREGPRDGVVARSPTNNGVADRRVPGHAVLNGHAASRRACSSRRKTKQVHHRLEDTARSYTFKVAAHNKRGWSALSTVSADGHDQVAHGTRPGDAAAAVRPACARRCRRGARPPRGGGGVDGGARLRQLARAVLRRV